MEPTKNAENTGCCGCANNYTSETFMESFGVNDDEVKKCGGCGNFIYDNGICHCSKFQK